VTSTTQTFAEHIAQTTRLWEAAAILGEIASSCDLFAWERRTEAGERADLLLRAERYRAEQMRLIENL